MTCADIREHLVDLVDQRLHVARSVEALRPGGERPVATGANEESPPVGRAAIDEHLAACAECREELTRLEQTVAFVRAIDAPRAPAGFVDRVVTAVRPPWYRRLARAVLWPLHVKVPLEAAAILLVSLGVVYVFHRTPDLQEAARMEPRPPALSAPPPGTSVDAGSSEPRAVPGERSGTRGLARDRSQFPADAAHEVPGRPSGGVLPGGVPGADRDGVAERQEFDEREAPAAERAPAAPTPPTTPGGLSMTSGERRHTEDTAPARTAAPEERPADADTPVAPPAPASTATADPGAETIARRPTPPPDRDDASGPTAAKTAAPAPERRGRLAVGDLDDAERRVRELTARHGGAVIARREAGDAAVILELTVAERAYGEFLHALPALGRWTPEGEAPALPARVRLEIRLER